MKKYDFVLYHRQKEDFLDKLQDLGLVDITTTGWEPDDAERELMLSIERHRAAVARLKDIAGEEDLSGMKPYKSGEEAYECYLKASGSYDNLQARITQAEKEVWDLRVWGDFDPQALRELGKSGINFRYFSSYSKEYDAQVTGWQQQYTIVPINEVEGVTYFIVVTDNDLPVEINAQELKPLSEDYRDKEEEIRNMRTEQQQWYAILKRCAASVGLIEEHGAEVQDKLQFSQIANSSLEGAEGTLVLMEGWATRETEVNVDKMLEQYPGLFYMKSDPTPEDETPVLLKNNKFNKMFEFIGNFYSLPKYGTLDLTSAFGPFYVLFFGMCLADAGYGLIFLVAGIYMLKKLKPSMKGISRLVILCGISTIVCGTFMGSFFGIPFAEYEQFASIRRYILSTDNLFVLALAIGIIQILFGMAIKVVSFTKQFGFRYALSTIGWMLVIVSSLAAYLLPERGIEGFSFNSPVYLVLLGVGAFMMLFLNSPGKNPLVNLGAGLWNTYNDVTGILSDVLSYIRLFAIGLSGGILALVFNQLALGLSPDIPVVRQISIVLILLIGHGINLFMSSLSSFVHPMRLTFVEFYKNAGFETTQREFTPFKRKIKE